MAMSAQCRQYDTDASELSARLGSIEYVPTVGGMDVT